MANIADDIISLIRDDTFYGVWLTNMIRKERPSVGTIGVGIENKRYVLYYNPEFYFGFKKEIRMEILRHEALHAIYDHPVTMRPLHMINPKIIQYAADLEVNQYLRKDYLPKDGIFFDEWVKQKLVPNSPKAGTQFYFDELMKTAQDQPEGLGHDDPVEGFGEELTEADIQEIKHNTQEMLVKTLDAAKKAGKVPGFIEEYISLKYDERKVSRWKQTLKAFVMRKFGRTGRLTNYRKSNRFEDERGLIRKKTKLKVLCAIDTSWSMQPKELNEVAIQLFSMKKHGLHIDLIQFDTQVTDRSYDVSKSEIETLKFKGRGGTDFDPVVEAINEERGKYSCALILTDGYANCPREKLRVPTLWIINSGGMDLDAMRQFGGLAVKIDN